MAAGVAATEVRVAYDAHALYVGVRNFDTAPDSIAQQLGRRDADDIYADWFFVGFDSYGDGAPPSCSASIRVACCATLPVQRHR
jgi:hypothetical protein